MKNLLRITFFVLTAQACFSQTLPPVAKQLGAAQVYTKGDSLFVTTGEIERKWVLTGNGLVTQYVKNLKSGRVYSNSQKDIKCDWNLKDAGVAKYKDKAQQSSTGCDWNWLAWDTVPLPARLVSLTAQTADDEGFTNQYLEVVSRFQYESLKIEVEHIVWVYPGAPGIRTQLKVKAMLGFLSETFPKADTITKYYGGTQPVPGARAEYLPLDFSVKNQRIYWGYYNDPGNRNDQSLDMLQEEVVKGYPLFQIEANNWASGIGVDYGNEGICVIKESPKTVNQQGHNTGSFYSGTNGLLATGLGLNPEEIVQDRFRECWANWTVVYSGGNDDMQLAVKRFDRARYPAFAQRDLFILSNTWGPANPGGGQFTEEPFVMKEIPALANLGVDVFQIDGGWGKGEVFLPKYTNGWNDIKSAADKAGLKMGLWVSILLPKFEHLKYNLNELGVASWKIDFDHLKERKDFENRTNTYRELMKRSWMKTQFSLCPEYDNLRYGWYYAKEYGSIWFQNIQEALPEHLTMVPYHVIRQHWLFAKYLNTNKIQVMLQNPQRTNRERSDAYLHGHSYCFAMGLPFIPCFFQGAQFLDDAGTQELKQLILVYKKYREDMFNCYTFPVGDIPSNDSWKGFQMVGENQDKGYLLLFRELHNGEAQKQIVLKYLAGKTVSITNLETGKVTPQKVSAEGMANFSLRNPASYLFLQYSVLKEQ